METVRGSVPTTIKLPRHIDALWADVARHIGVNKTAAFTLAIRELAKKEGLPIPTDDEKDEAAA